MKDRDIWELKFEPCIYSDRLINKLVDLNDIITEGILGSHRVNDPALFGLSKPGSLFVGQSHILDSLEIFRTQYVVPRQRFIEKCIKRLARVNGITEDIKLKEYSLNFTKMDVSIGDVLSILTSNISEEAKRSMLILNGYSEEDADKLIKPVVSLPVTPKNNIQ
jgi:hypothetical protein